MWRGDYKGKVRVRGGDGEEGACELRELARRDHKDVRSGMGRVKEVAW